MLHFYFNFLILVLPWGRENSHRHALGPRGGTSRKGQHLCLLSLPRISRQYRRSASDPWKRWFILGSPPRCAHPHLARRETERGDVEVDVELGPVAQRSLGQGRGEGRHFSRLCLWPLLVTSQLLSRAGTSSSCSRRVVLGASRVGAWRTRAQCLRAFQFRDCLPSVCGATRGQSHTAPGVPGLLTLAVSSRAPSCLHCPLPCPVSGAPEPRTQAHAQQPLQSALPEG